MEDVGEYIIVQYFILHRTPTLIGALINRLISDYWVALFRYWAYLLVEIRLLEALIGENFTYEKLCFTYEMFCYWNHLLEKFLPIFLVPRTAGVLRLGCLEAGSYSLPQDIQLSK